MDFFTWIPDKTDESTDSKAVPLSTAPAARVALRRVRYSRNRPSPESSGVLFSSHDLTFPRALTRFVDPASERDEKIDGRRHEQGRQNHLRDHLSHQQLGDREHAIEGDRDEDERVDDLAQHAGNAGPEPEELRPFPRLQAAEDSNVEKRRNSVGQDPAEPDSR